MKKSAKILCAILALVLTLGVGVGGTLAWLAAKTGPVENTFTFGNLAVELKETPAEYQIVPGTTISKDPKAAVVNADKGDPIDAYLFVEITEVNWPEYKIAETQNRKVDYVIGDDWTVLEGATDVPGTKVIYREVKASEYKTPYSILKNDQVTVDGSLTKAEVDAVTAKGDTTLTFTAYAVQKSHFESDPAGAWAARADAVLTPNK